VVHRGAAAADEFIERIRALGLSANALNVVLRPEQYQLLQIEAPQVPPDEIRSAARWKIRELVSTHVDDLTLDVMRVGDERVRATGQLFVVAARNTLVRELLELGEKLDCPVQVIDVHDTAQRNLQSLLASKEGVLERANAALVIVSNDLALLTICAYGELFYSRRIELGHGFVESRWLGRTAVDSPSAEAFSTVPEYVPEYVPGGSFLDDAFSESYGATTHTVSSAVAANDESAQRFVVEVQRSLDVWERTWSSVPLHGLKVFAGARSQELAQWLSQELGLTVAAMDVDAYFPGFEGGTDADRSLCWPLLGALLRTDT
jgi:MSHA biogenesis protein MshI